MAGYLPFDEPSLIGLYKKRITILEILQDEWFKKGYKPPKFEQDEDVPCCLHEERKPPYLLRRRGREHHLSRVQPRKFVTLSCSSPEGPNKRFSKYFGPDL
ncbi:hypothetical protein PVK06_034859 [Gossypium arboreum]|uniref:Uncharacterized protein n=1 Tax=Gossypium arboreum TaxID=29729 RepID=A0ABR0NFC1_GOSAR|nr:hypothetical protein PVK06_034859 [Gossypium arboreum]